MTALHSEKASAPKRTRRSGLRARVRTAGIGAVTYIKERTRLKYVVAYLEEGHERIKGFRNYDQASAWRQARIEAATALPAGTASHTFGEAASLYLESPHGKRVGRAAILRLHVLPEFEHLALHEIEQATVLAFYRKIQDAGYHRSHHDRIIAVFRKVIEGAIARGWLAVDYRIPPVRFSYDTTPARRAWTKKSAQRLPSLQTVNLLLAEATGFLRIVLHLCILAGMRIGEILALQWGDVDFVKKRIYVGASVSDHDRYGRTTCTLPPVPAAHHRDDPNKFHRRPPKTADGYRYIHMTPRLIAVLQAVRPQAPERSDRVVFGPGDKQLTQGAVYLHYLRLQARLGLAEEEKVRRNGKVARKFSGGFTMHALRHAAVAMMIFSGVKIEQIRRVLGHSDVSVTLDIYGYLIKLREDGQKTWPSADGDRSQSMSHSNGQRELRTGVSEQVIGGRVHRIIGPPRSSFP